MDLLALPLGGGAAATDGVLTRILVSIDRTTMAGARDALMLLLGF